MFGHFAVMLLSFVCHFNVILLSFWERENAKKNSLRHDYHDRPFVTLWRHQIQGTSAEAFGKPAGDEEDRAGELALGKAWGEPAQKPGEGAGAGVKWPRAGKRGRPGNSKNATLPAREFFFFAFLLHFPNWESFFGHFFAYTGFATFTACLIRIRKRQENDKT